MNIWELHPALVHFPIALLLSGVALDLFGWWRSEESLVRAATWLLLAGVATGVLAANFGLLALMYWHLGTAAGSLVLFAWVATVRCFRRTTRPSLSSRVIGVVAAGILTAAGYLGGRIVYRGGAGVDPELLASAVREKHSHGQADSEDMQSMKHEAIGNGDRKDRKEMDHGETGKTQDKDMTGMEHGTKGEGGKQPAQKQEMKGMQHGSMSGDREKTTTGDQKTGNQDHKKVDEEALEGEESGTEFSRQGTNRDGREGHKKNGKEQGTTNHRAKGRDRESQKFEESPKDLPRVPPADAKAAEVPPGYRVEVVADELDYPTSIEFDDAGTMYVAEGGYIYGDDVAPARVLRFAPNGTREVIADQLSGPVTDLLWHEGRLFISHRGKISALESAGVRDLVTDLPSLGDHHNNQMTIGPDGRLYFGQGTATNSGVVGLDNFKMGWLAKHSTVHDVPAKEIRLRGEERGQGHVQEFETPSVLAMLAEGNVNRSGEAEPTDGRKEKNHSAERKLGSMTEEEKQNADMKE